MADEEPRKQSRPVFGTNPTGEVRQSPDHDTARKVDIDAPLSVDTIYQLINNSYRSAKPLFLRGANLSGAMLVGVNLWEASLDFADLSDANLTNSNLSGAGLSGADLRFANLAGAEMPGANLDGAKLFSARYNAKTQWPEGFDPEAAGAVLVE